MPNYPLESGIYTSVVSCLLIRFRWSHISHTEGFDYSVVFDNIEG